MNINEIFYSIQGEGVSTGIPSVFLRLASCNLSCVWCDTKYTWLFTDPLKTIVEKKARKLGVKVPDDVKVYSIKDESISMDIKDVLKEIQKFPCKRIVLTGGEPTLQHQDKDLLNLLKFLKAKGYYIEIETNCTILPNNDFVSCIAQWNISPKIGSSGNENERENSECYRFYNSLENSWFKFVIVTQEDLEEVENLIKKYKIQNEKVLLMPEASSKSELQEKSLWLIDACKEKGFRFSNRLHIAIWGKERGI